MCWCYQWYNAQCLNLFSYLKVEHYLISLIYYALDHCTACNTFRFIIVIIVYTAGYIHGNSVGNRVMNNADFFLML